VIKRYKEVFDPNHSQECICHRGPMNRGLEESPGGDFVDIEDYEELKNQLAKANERAKELEGFYATYEREFKAVAKWAISMQNDICEGKYHSNTPEGMIYSESTWVDCRWQDVIDPLFTSHEDALKKFAIEKKIEALDWLRSNTSIDMHMAIAMNLYAEQLRKEQKSDCF